MLLNCHTYFSLGYGTIKPTELIDEAIARGFQEIVVADINTTSAVLGCLNYAKNKQVKVIPGVDFRNHLKPCYVAISINNKGFQEINEHLTAHLHHNKPFHAQAPHFNDVWVVYPLKQYKGWPLRDNEFIGVALHEVKYLHLSPYHKLKHKLVILQPTSIKNTEQFSTHQLLRAMSENTIWTKLNQFPQAAIYDTFYSLDTFLKTYKSYPFIINNTLRLIQSCDVNFVFDKRDNKSLNPYTDSIEGDIELLRAECAKNLTYRYPTPNKTVFDRIEKELKIIEEYNFASYYLINWDIISYAKHKGYFHVGRGSGANSIIAYLLNITNVDPIELDLYFERFINPARSNPPDFDIDFSWRDRDDIISYIFKRFGTKHTALLGTYNTLRSDAVIRELGKVYGLPPKEIDKLQQNPQLSKFDHAAAIIKKNADILKGFPNHISIHASGILITQQPITAYTATIIPPKGFPTTQFSMIEAEEIGIVKFDILSQRGLGKIKDTLDIIKENHNIEIDIHQVKPFMQDTKIKDMLRTGNTLGCFYIESPAMRGLLTKLKADDYLRLVAASSIIRPGVSKSGMMREYILRFRNEDLRKKAKDKLPELYNLLEETYGVMVYQEDVIKVAHLFADLSLDEADTLRKSMSWKTHYKGMMVTIQDKFFNNCLSKGYSLETTTQIWNQIESFGNFAFAKGHSASYAIESYQALYLKAYYPLEYMVATINNGGGFYNRAVYINEARLHGAKIVPPCINNSSLQSTLKGNTIYLGIELISSLNPTQQEQIILNRQQNGPYTSLVNLIKRLNLTQDESASLIKIGALKSIHPNNKTLLWQNYLHFHPQSITKTPQLFPSTPTQEVQTPNFSNSPIDEVFDQYYILGFSLHSPFTVLANTPNLKTRAKDLPKLQNQNISIIGSYVAIKEVHTTAEQTMYFGTFLDQDGQIFDTIHFPSNSKSNKLPRSRGINCYKITGKVVNEYDFISIDVHSIEHEPVIDREFT